MNVKRKRGRPPKSVAQQMMVIPFDPSGLAGGLEALRLNLIELNAAWRGFENQYVQFADRCVTAIQNARTEGRWDRDALRKVLEQSGFQVPTTPRPQIEEEPIDHRVSRATEQQRNALERHKLSEET